MQIGNRVCYKHDSMKSFQRRGGRPVERCSPLEKKIFSAVFELDVCSTSETFRYPPPPPPPRKHRYCIHGIIYHRVLFAEIYFGVEILKITRRGGSTFKGRKKSFTRKRKLLAILYIVSPTFKLEKKKKKRKKRKIILTAV